MKKKSDTNKHIMTTVSAGDSFSFCMWMLLEVNRVSSKKFCCCWAHLLSVFTLDPIDKPQPLSHFELCSVDSISAIAYYKKVVSETQMLIRIRGKWAWAEHQGSLQVFDMIWIRRFFHINKHFLVSISPFASLHQSFVPCEYWNLVSFSRWSYLQQFTLMCGLLWPVWAVEVSPNPRYLVYLLVLKVSQGLCPFFNPCNVFYINLLCQRRKLFHVKTNLHKKSCT